MKSPTLLALALSTTFLAACGGGGGGTPAAAGATGTGATDLLVGGTAATGKAIAGATVAANFHESRPTPRMMKET